jgi:hypothetical protein
VEVSIEEEQGETPRGRVHEIFAGDDRLGLNIPLLAPLTAKTCIIFSVQLSENTTVILSDVNGDVVLA